MPDQDKAKDRDSKDEADTDLRRDEATRWREQNAEAIKAYNEWIERDGLPFARFRRF